MSEASAIERFIDYIVHHNAGVIEALIAGIMITALFISYRALTAKPEANGGGNLKDLEETMQKILERASMIPNGAAIAGGAPSAEILGQIEVLKKDLEERQQEIATLRESGGAAKGISAEDKSKLEGTIKELQEKLAEYEIISEDIADLSFYKEENAKLQKQLEGLKSAPAAVAPAAEPEIVGKSKAKEEAEAKAKVEVSAPVVEAVAVPEPEPTPAPVVTPEPVAISVETQSVKPEEAVDDDLMAEFAKAIEDQRQSAAAASPAPAAAVPTPVPAKSAAADVASSINSGFDLDKMVAEAAGIGANSETDSVANPLEANVDENKLINEASQLGVETENGVMNQFEKFVKKGDS
jgi:myosin heavy subunit